MGVWEALSQDSPRYPTHQSSSHNVFKGGLLNRRTPDKVRTSKIPLSHLELAAHCQAQPLSLQGYFLSLEWASGTAPTSGPPSLQYLLGGLQVLCHRVLYMGLVLSFGNCL